VGIFLKDPDARLDYAVDWSADFLGAATIAASTWTVDPTGVTVGATVATPSRTGATIEGGVPGIVYRVVNHITLSDGRRDDRTLALRIEAR